MMDDNTFHSILPDILPDMGLALWSRGQFVSVSPVTLAHCHPLKEDRMIDRATDGARE